MESWKSKWRSLPRSTRKPIVIFVGFTLILISGLIGWIPGPGGMVPFLLGIAVLATEFTWAERFRDLIIDSGSRLGKALKKYPLIGGFIVALLFFSVWGFAFFIYEYTR